MNVYDDIVHCEVRPIPGRNDEYEMALFIDRNLIEFASELGSNPELKGDLISAAKNLIKERQAKLRITMLRVVIGGTVLMFIPIHSDPVSAATQTQDGRLAIPTMIHPPKILNVSPRSPSIILDGKLMHVHAMLVNSLTYVPIRAVAEHMGAKVDWDHDSRTVTVRKEDAMIRFAVGSTIASINGRSVTTPASFIREGMTFVPLRFLSETLGLEVAWDGQSWTVHLTSPPKAVNTQDGRHQVEQAEPFPSALGSGLIESGEPTTVQTTTQSEAEMGGSHIPKGPNLEIDEYRYQVAAGDSLWKIANHFGTTIEALRSLNDLNTDLILVGQWLSIPQTTTEMGPVSENSSTPIPASTSEQSPTHSDPGVSTSVTYTIHSVRAGDNLWNLSVHYQVPFLELLHANSMTVDSRLSIGQLIRVPIHHIPVKPVVSEKHGELLDWWTEARYVFSTGKTATITDHATGRTFRIKHTMGGNHADSEPLSASDAQVMKELWGGAYNWTPRAIIVEVDGRKLAAAMHSMPHGDQTIQGNNYEGHFCIHFLNSQRHSDGKVQDSMQRQVMIAAGINTM